MQIHIRRAGAKDLRHLIHHRRAMFEEMGYRGAAELDQVDETSRQYFTPALAAESYVGWMAEESGTGRVVGGGGLVIASWPGFPGESRSERVWILNMYTEPDARRRGIARKLLDVMIDWCRNRGLSIVSLHASPAGRPVYESFGFQPTNEMRLQLK